MAWSTRAHGSREIWVNATSRAKTVLKNARFASFWSFFDVFGLVGKLSLSSFVSFDAGNDSIISEFTT